MEENTTPGIGGIRKGMLEVISRKTQEMLLASSQEKPALKSKGDISFKVNIEGKETILCITWSSSHQRTVTLNQLSALVWNPLVARRPINQGERAGGQQTQVGN